MQPDADVVLRELARALMEDFAPKLPTSFEQGAAMRFGMLAQAASEEFDRAASRRVEENSALRALFARAVDIVEDADLRERLQGAAGTSDASLRVRDLDLANRALRALLVELHACVEGAAGAPARALGTAIWAELSASTDRRMLSLGRF